MKINYLSLILAAITSFLLIDKCTENKPSEDVKIVRDTIVQLDTHIVRGKPRIIEHWRDTGSIVLDTIQVLQDWSTTYVYQDSVRDGLASIDIIDTISRNTIQGRSIRYVLPTTTITETRTQTIRTKGVSVGLIGTAGSIAAQAQYITPKWNASVGYGTNGIILGAGIMISPRK
jgi:hypothetical protein